MTVWEQCWWRLKCSGTRHHVGSTMSQSACRKLYVASICPDSEESDEGCNPQLKMLYVQLIPAAVSRKEYYLVLGLRWLCQKLHCIITKILQQGKWMFSWFHIQILQMAGAEGTSGKTATSYTEYRMLQTTMKMVECNNQERTTSECILHIRSG